MGGWVDAFLFSKKDENEDEEKKNFSLGEHFQILIK